MALAGTHHKALAVMELVRINLAVDPDNLPINIQDKLATNLHLTMASINLLATDISRNTPTAVAWVEPVWEMDWEMEP